MQWERVVAVAPSFAETPVAALNPQFGMLIAGNLVACGDVIALPVANGGQAFAAFGTLATQCENGTKDN